MVWVALLYAVGGTWLTDWIGRPLVRLNYDQQRYEADFRFSLVRFRENTEGVALYRGERDELRGFRGRFEAVVAQLVGHHAPAEAAHHLHRPATRRARGSFPSSSPPRATSPARSASAGSCRRSAPSARCRTRSACSSLVQGDRGLVRHGRAARRLPATLDRVRTRWPATAASGTPTGDDALAASSGVDLHLPDGQPLITHVNLSLRRGDTCCSAAPPARARARCSARIAGIWPFGRGEIRSPGGRARAVPAAAALPADRHAARRGELSRRRSRATRRGRCARRWRRCGLGKLAARLDEAGHWALQLSGGEQQRIAVRAGAGPASRSGSSSTRRPPRSTRPPRSASTGCVRERLPGTTVFSVGHRATLRPFHERQLQVQPADGGPASIVD